MIYYIIALLVIGIFAYSYFSKTPNQRKDYRINLIIYIAFFVSSIFGSYLITIFQENLTIIAGLYVAIPGVFVLFNIFYMIKTRNKNILSSQVFLIIIGVFYFYITYNIYIMEADELDTLKRVSSYLIFSAIPLMILALIIMGISRLRS